MRYLEIGDYEFDLVKLGAILTVLAVIIGAPVYWFALRVPPQLDHTPNLSSPYDPTQGAFTYPFNGEEMKNAFAEIADNQTFSDGAQVLNGHPLIAKSFPASFGAPVKLFVWFPDAALDPSSPYSYTHEDYRYYRAIVVPANNPAAFKTVVTAYQQSKESGQEADPLLLNAPIQLGFKIGTEPPASTEYAQVYALYHWSSSYQNSNPGATASLPTFLIGSYQPMEESAISDPPDNVLTVNTVLRNGPLTMSIKQVEFGTKYTRVLVTVDNSNNQDTAWGWQESAHLRVDNKTFKPQLSDFSEQESDNKDVLPTVFPPAQTSGYIFFDRVTVPEEELALFMPLAQSEDRAIDETIQWTQSFNLNNIVAQ